MGVCSLGGKYMNIGLCDFSPLKKSQIDKVADIGFFRNFQTAINDDYTVCVQSIKTITFFSGLPYITLLKTLDK